jgi:hypothetical protein
MAGKNMPPARVFITACEQVGGYSLPKGLFIYSQGQAHDVEALTFSK